MSERRAKELRRKAKEEGREPPPPGRPLTLSELGFPRYVKGPQQFSKDGALKDWRVLLPTIMAQPWWPELRERVFTGGTRAETGWRDQSGDLKPHRPMVIPEVFLAWIAFHLSDTVDLRPWVESTSDEAMWASLGVAEVDGVCRPTYDVVYDQFRKLYPLLGVLREYTDDLAKIIVKRVPDFLVDIVIDGTEWAVAAQLYHDCADGECPLGKAGENLGKFARGPLHNMTSEQAAAMRAQAIDAGEEGTVGAHHAKGSAADRVSGDVREAYRVARETDNGVRWYLRIKTTAGHWFMIRDVGAGIRMYEGKNGQVSNSWVGRHLITSTCLATGLCGAAIAASASKNEPEFYPEIIATGERATGWPTLTLSTDKAGTIRKVTLAMSRDGRLHITPLRKHKAIGESAYNVVLTTRTGRQLVIDADDRIRCETCGHATSQTFVRPRNGRTPFVRVSCPTLACADEEYAITLEPNRLLPIPRYDRQYLIRKKLHSEWERQHRIQRARNNVAAKAKTAAPRQALQERAEADLHTAVFLDYLRYCLRLGEIKPPPEVDRHVQVCDLEIITYEDKVAGLVDDLAKRRREHGLHRPFGTKLAEDLGGTLLPPKPYVIPTTRAGP